MKVTLAVIGSMLLHGALLLGMNRIEPPDDPPPPSTVVAMTVKRPPPPPPPPPPAPVEETIPEPTVTPKRVPKRRAKTITKSAPPPPPPNAPPPPPPSGFSVDMSSTVVASKGPAVRAVEGGGNAFADPNDRSLEAGEKRTRPPPPPSGSGTGGPDDAYEITEEPRFLTPEDERTPPYPEEAKAAQISGRVMLRVYIDESGRVARIKVLSGLGGGCTATAVRWAKAKWRFAPAKAGDQAVGMWITVPVTFILDR